MQPGTRFPPQLTHQRSGLTYDLDVSECVCPKCGFQLTDWNYLERMPQPDSWNLTSKARCADCGHVFTVHLIIEEARANPQTRRIAMGGPLAPPIRSWFGSMRRPRR